MPDNKKENILGECRLCEQVRELQSSLLGIELFAFVLALCLSEGQSAFLYQQKRHSDVGFNPCQKPSALT